eukprot:scaffold93152_cov61-Phaeocystis_antarctica.AAC.2
MARPSPTPCPGASVVAEAEHAQPEHTALPRPRKVRRGREGLRQQEGRHLAELVRREEGEQRAAIGGARAGVRRGVRALLRGQSRGDGRHHEIANRHKPLGKTCAAANMSRCMFRVASRRQVLAAAEARAVVASVGYHPSRSSPIALRSTD